MNNRERVKAVMQYEPYDRMPVVHFGYWDELLEKWAAEGYLKESDIEGVADGNAQEQAVSKKLGFDFNWMTIASDKTTPLSSIYPQFERRVLGELPDGRVKAVNEYGVIQIEKPGITSIPIEADHLLKDRRSWEEYIKPRLLFSQDRIDWEYLQAEAERDAERQDPLGVFCGSLFGEIRNLMGLEGVSCLYVDDPELYDEIIETVGELQFQVTKALLSTGITFDFAHFWEDICCRNGPLISPRVFEEKVGPRYKRITDLLHEHGITIVSVDCDGYIDFLIPGWIHNGVNTMFPIEVGTWEASIEPWRQTYGKELRGVGGMNKHVFEEDYRAVDKEIERLKPLVELGGFIPCPDHRIPISARWENIQYYCDRMRETFS